MAVSWFLPSLGGMEGCSRRKEDRGDYEDKWIDAGAGGSVPGRWREGLARSLARVALLLLVVS